MKRTHALIAVLALMSMTTAAHAANAQEREQGMFPERVVSSQVISPAQWREDRLSAMLPTAGVGDKAESKQTRCMALGKC
jgi:hypothetical protein